MYALPCVEAPLTHSLVDAAVEVYRRARRAGITVRSGVHCLVAACAVHHAVTIVHCDRDYSKLAKVVPLSQVDIGPRLRATRRR